MFAIPSEWVANRFYRLGGWAFFFVFFFRWSILEEKDLLVNGRAKEVRDARRQAPAATAENEVNPVKCNDGKGIGPYDVIRRRWPLQTVSDCFLQRRREFGLLSHVRTAVVTLF